MPEKKSDKRKYERDEPVSLRPLNLEEALAALMGVKPKPEAAAEQNGCEPAPSTDTPTED